MTRWRSTQSCGHSSSRDARSSHGMARGRHMPTCSPYDSRRAPRNLTSSSPLTRIVRSSLGSRCSRALRPQRTPNHAPITPRPHPDHTPITPQSLPNHSPITSQSPPPKKGALERLVGRRVPSGACHHAAHAALAQPDAAHRAAVDGRGLAGAPGPPLEGLVRAALANLEGDERRAEEELRRLDARDAPRLSQECLRVCQFS